MRPLLPAALLVPCVLLLAACGAVEGSGRIARRTVEPGGTFRNLRVEGASRLTVRTGGTPSIEVEADDNVLDLVRAETKDGLLRVWTDGEYVTKTALHITITAETLAQVATSGAVNATVDVVEGDAVVLTADGASVLDVAAARAKNVKATSRGASQVRVGLQDAETLTIVATGASSVVARGACRSADVTAEGASRASGMTAVRAKVVTTGTSQVDLDVGEHLRADVSGVSRVTYGGEPKVEGTVNKTSTIAKRAENEKRAGGEKPPEAPLPGAK